MTKNSRKMAIKMKCLECSGNSKKEVRECVIKNCALYPFRKGRVEKATQVEQNK